MVIHFALKWNHVKWSKWTPAGAVILRDTECCAQQHQNIANQFCNFLNRLDEIPLLWDAFTLWSWFESCRRTLSHMRKVCIQSTGTVASATHALNFVAGAHSPSANEICFGRMSAQESWMDMLLPQDMSLRFQGCSQGKAPQSPNGRFRFHPEALDNWLKSRMIVFRKTAEISQILIAHFPL